MSLFKKPNRKFKRRSRADSDEEESEQVINTRDKVGDNLDDAINLEPPDEIRKEPTTSKNIKLSFDDDGDVTEFKLKKSNSSLKALKQLERKRKELKKLSKQTELANQTKSVRKLMETNKDCLEEKSTDQPNQIINLEEDDEDGEDYLRMYKKSKDPIDMFDTKTIEKLKKQRFLAKRQESDYISLNSNRDDFKYEASSSSRLVREDPSDKEEICIDDDEDNADLDDDRVNFYMDKSDLQKERIKEAFFNAQSEELHDNVRLKDDSDNELEEWERAQINKGIGFKQQRDLSKEDFSNYLMTNQPNQTNPYDPPAYIKLGKPALTKDKLLKKYREELLMVNSTLDILYNQFNNIELTIGNIKETLDDQTVDS